MSQSDWHLRGDGAGVSPSGQALAQSRRYRLALLLSVPLYVLSCLLPAARTPGAAKGDPDSTYVGGVLLLNGLTWACGCLPLSAAEHVWKGRNAELGKSLAFTALSWSPWLANPLFYCGAWQLREGRRGRAAALAGAAFALAAFGFTSEFVREQHILEYPAYYAWAASPALLGALSLIPQARRGRTRGEGET